MSLRNHIFFFVVCHPKNCLIFFFTVLEWLPILVGSTDFSFLTPVSFEGGRLCFLWVCVCVCVFPPLWSKLLQVQNKPLIILLARIVPCAHSKTSYIQQRHCCPYKNHQAYLWSWKWGKITLRRNIGFVERMWSLIKIGFLIRWKEVELWMEAR